MRYIILTLTMGVALTSFGSAPVRPGNTTIKEISEYVSPKNSTSRPPHFTYLPSGTEYALLSEDKKCVETYDIKSGAKTGTLIDLSHVRETQIADMEGFIISPDASKIIVYRSSEPIYRRSFKAEYYVYDVRSRILMPLSKEFEKTRIPVFSPDSRMVAFVAQNNIYIKKIDFNSEVAVTTDGSFGHIINGATDWTYEEEFYLTSTLAWSPDNTTLCYVRFDETDVPTYTLPLYEGTCPRESKYRFYPGIMSYKYPVAGEKNSTFSIHSYDVDTRKIKDIVLADKNIEYILRIDFGGSSERLMVSTLNRDQNHYEIYSVNPKTTVAKSVFVEKSEAWIAPSTYESIDFGPDAFTVMSSRTGYTHLYRYSYTGTLIETITEGDFDVTQYYGRDALGNYYYQTAQPTPMDRTVYKMDVKKHVAKVISEADGTTVATFSPGCQYAVFAYSNTETPTKYTLTTPEGKVVRVLEDNAAYSVRYLPKVAKKEFVQVPSDGLMLNGYIIRPKDFDPSRKYPLIMTQYSGPGSQTVLNRWEMDWMYYFVNKGYVVACVDGRGTGGRGNAFLYSVYGNLGYYETIDQINAAKYFATLPGIDGDRIGMFGWSYGGYETLMCMTDVGNPFACAVAVAPVTDWRFYDTVYTERYMQTPQQNDAGYNSSSPLKRAARMTGNVLIMYGTEDDNVHPANSLQFVSELQNSLLTCDMFVFPNKNHSINGCDARAVVYGRMFDYFSKNL